jgi:protein gp37
MSKKTSIEWADKTWNPINGRCPNACDYCYMWGRCGIGNRFKKVHDHPLRLDEKKLASVPKSGRVFVGSSTDMWADDVPNEWILNTLIKCQSHKSINASFFFLTKVPKRYLSLPLSEYSTDRTWFGATIDGTEKAKGSLIKIGELSLFGFNTFVSFEPLLVEPNWTLLYSNIKWIIIVGD